MKKLELVIGKMGSGKSTRTAEEIEKPASGRPILVVDIHSEDMYKDLPEIKISDVSAFCKTKKATTKKITFTNSSDSLTLSDQVKMVIELLKSFTRGILVFEDANIYLTPEILKLIKSKTRTDTTIICTFQTKGGAVSSGLLNEAEKIRLHDSIDGIDRFIRSVDPSLIEVITIAEILIKLKRETNPYFYLYIDFTNWTINGDFTRDDYRAACTDYLMRQFNFYDYFKNHK